MELTKTPDVPMPPRRFVPDGFEPKLNAIKALAGRLEERPLDSPDALRGWIYDWGELSSFVLSELMRRTTAGTLSTG